MNVVPRTGTDNPGHGGPESAEKAAQTARLLKCVIGGVGFDVSTVHENRYGLQGIRERSRLMQGSAVIERAPEKGASVMVELPVRTSVSPRRQAEG